jgi:hypothetical protein
MVLQRNRAALRAPTGSFEHEGLGRVRTAAGREVEARRFGATAPAFPAGKRPGAIFMIPTNSPFADQSLTRYSQC